MKNDTTFDPNWRDDVFDEKVLDIPLMLPRIIEPNSKIWVSKKVVRGEEVFGKFHKYDEPRILTAIVKKTQPHPGRRLTDEDGNEVSTDNPVWDFLNPPKAWMTDAAQELMTMYSAAKEARGDVLVGGLGMGIYPQYAFYLDRPVDSFTIVDSSPEVIEITTEAWLDRLEKEKRDKITIVEQKFEEFIKQTDKKFDTVFIDLWEDSDPRFLPFINRLIERVKPLCKEGGKIHIWAYALAVDAFVQLINYYESIDLDILRIPANIDPLLTSYGAWRALEENSGLPMEEYEKKALEFALSEKLPNLEDEYNRDLYFFPHGVGLADRQIIRQILSLSVRKKPGDEEGDKEVAPEPGSQANGESEGSKTE